MSQDIVASLCAKITCSVPLYKSQCRNSDQLICIEACAKLCNTVCFCMQAQKHVLDESMRAALMNSLRKTCIWCNKVCKNLSVNRSRYCLEFHKCCNDIIRNTGKADDAAIYRSSTHPPKNISVYSHELSVKCKNLLEEGCQMKALMLSKNEIDSYTGLCCEACLKMCNCVMFFACNACENIDADLLNNLSNLCLKCQEKSGNKFCNEKLKSLQTCIQKIVSK